MKEIFTGYAWRPMTPEEIEIMDATRVRPSMSEEPDPGDIYEGMDAVSETLLNLNGIHIVPEGVIFTPQNWATPKYVAEHGGKNHKVAIRLEEDA